MSRTIPTATTEAPAGRHANEGRAVVTVALPEGAGLAAALGELHPGERLVKLVLGTREVEREDGSIELDARDPAAFVRCVERLPELERLYFLGAAQTTPFAVDPPGAPVERMERGLLGLFRLVKALHRRLAAAELPLTIITTNAVAPRAGDAIDPAAASVGGFVNVLVREYPRAKVSWYDLSAEELAEASRAGRCRSLVAALYARPVEAGPTPRALRGGLLHERRLEGVELPPAAEETPAFRRGGTYVLLGGAGGLGTAFSHYLAENFQAQLVWIGRSALGPSTERTIVAIEQTGGCVDYVQADAEDADQLHRALVGVRARHGAIHGVIHTALVLRDKPLPAMDESSFRQALGPKVQASVNLMRALQDDPLDFALFFSSAQSFAANPGQSNYAAGCAFKDALAQWWAARVSYPVKVVNWGFWGSVGAVASDTYRQKLEAMGVHSIEAAEGVDAVKRLLAHPPTQLMAFKGTDELMAQLGASVRPESTVYAETTRSVFETLTAAVPPVARDRAAWAAVQRFGRRLSAATLRSMGAFHAAGERTTRDELAARLGILPQFARLYGALLQILSEAQLLRVAGDELEALDSDVARWSDLNPTALDDERERLARDFPAMAALVRLLCTCINSYSEVLRGKRPATEVLFPNGSMHLLDDIYRNNTTADYFNEIVASVARRGLDGADPAQPFRILEVGAGTGGTTAQVLEQLARHETPLEYVYTDVSKAFLAAGKKQFAARYPFVRFALLDAERDPSAQGFEPGSFDLVLATNVLHATRRIRQTLSSLKVALKRNGCLVINEATAAEDFTTLIFGLLGGWWAYEDEAQRLPGSPLLSPARWEAALRAEGFARVATLGEPADGGTDMPQRVIVAESDGVVRLMQPDDQQPEVVPAGSSAVDAVVVETAGAAVSPSSTEAPVEHAAQIERAVLGCVSQVLEIDLARFGADDAFAELGVDSVLGVQLIDEINGKLNAELRSTDLFNFATPSELVAHLAETLPVPTTTSVEAAPVAEIVPTVSPAAPWPNQWDATSDFPLLEDDEDPKLVDLPVPVPLPEPQRQASVQLSAETPPPTGEEGIAIVGMAGRFPGASDVDGLWELLSEGRCAIGEVGPDRWDVEGFFGAAGRRSGRPFPGRAGMLDDVDAFDPLFFGISPKEAELMDPQQRLFFEQSWKAFEDAGYSQQMLRESRCGVYAGCGPGDYRVTLRQNGVLDEPYTLMGNSTSVLPARVSYLLNLRGPSIALDTACSASLVAVHLACEAIRNGSIELALAGGVHVMSTPEFALLANEAGMLAPDGVCRAFDERANGFVPAEGVGMVVLKSLRAARRDGDRIRAVIRGSAINQDGKSNGITAPNGAAQTALEVSLYEDCGVDPETIGYVETHGTGTKLGDPVEINALAAAFRRFSDERQFCAVGSIKTNIGHATMAAGIAGLMKVVLSLERQQIPPSLNFEQPNEHIDFAESPFFVPTQLTEWPASGDGVRRAALSSFGFSGTNAHLLVDQAPEAPSRSQPKDVSQLVVLSAKTEAALQRRLVDLARWLERDAGRTPLVDIAYTALCRRTQFSCRWALVADDLAALRRAAGQGLAGEQNDALRGDAAGASPRLVEQELGRRLIAELASAARDPQPVAERRKQLRMLAELHVGGCDLPWAELFTDARVVSLPSYSFARQRYWVGSSAEEAPLRVLSVVPVEKDATARPSLENRSQDRGPIQVEGDFVALEPDWVAAEPTSQLVAPRGVIAVLTNAESAPLGQWLAAKCALRRPALGGVRWVVVDASDAESSTDRVDARSGNGVSAPPWLDRRSITSGEEVAGRIRAQVAAWRAEYPGSGKSPDEAPLVGVVDLSDLYPQPRGEDADCRGKIALLQALLREHVESRRSEGFNLLHLTRGLQPFGATEPSLAGACFSGLVSAVGAEYRSVVAKTADVDLATSDLEGLSAVIERELCARDSVAQSCWRDGVRHLPHLHELQGATAAVEGGELPEEALDKVLLITGGTGGIGRTLARWWVERGGRRLAILGLDSVPPRAEWQRLLDDPQALTEQVARVRELLALEEQGAELELYLGRLTDRDALSAFLARVRRNLGPIGGVYHCAGAFVEGHPPFIRRDLHDTPRVVEPKVDGLVVLDELLADDPLHFFVLFSSISALFPSLAVGISDYAMANAFMAAFAAQRARSGRPELQAILWSNWRDVGIGEVDNANYRQLGLTTHSSVDGLALLERMHAWVGRVPVVAVSGVDRTYFDSGKLLRLRQDQQAKREFVRGDEDLRREVEQVELDEPTRRWLRGLLAAELKIRDDLLDDRARFEELGVDSILMVELLQKIESEIGSPVEPTVFLEYPTVELLAKYFQVAFAGQAERVVVGSVHESAEQPRPAPQPESAAQPPAVSGGSPPEQRAALDAGGVAVIGIGCHFPRSPDKESFWRNLRAGYDGIGVVPESRWDADTLYRPDHESERSISKWGGFIEGIEQFDPAYFGLREEMAPQIDPLIRQLLEASVQCVRDAGYADTELRGRRCGVFVGSRVSTYARRLERAVFDTVVGVGQNFIAAHVSHFFDLRGPNMVVDTACSSSLVSLHLACASLATGESEMALAGGVDLLLDEVPYVTLSEARALSPDGRCFTFDERANGFVPGEGCGVVLLKPLERAIADGDRIYGVIDATALNNDGRTMGITTPNPQAQSDVIREALRRADVGADTVSYIEAHGTGTMIGDPIELKGLLEVFREHTDERQFCAVGSVKSNIGHLFSAAGIASLVKTLLCLHHRELVPTVNCDRPNPRFAFEQSPFFPNTEHRPWQPHNGIRRAGISSFGFGGTNAHCLVSEFSPEAFEHYRCVREELDPPTYARKRYWLEPKKQHTTADLGEPAPLPDLLDLEWTDPPTGAESVSVA